MTGMCDERVYTGDQWTRIHGRHCRNRAAIRLVALHGGEDRTVCKSHATMLVRQGNYKMKERIA